MVPLNIVESDLEHALRVCRERIRRRPSHLVSVVEGLEPPLLSDLFACCYAAMRVLDDMVDERYVVAAERSKEEVLAYVDLWCTQAEAAASGNFVMSTSAIEPEIFGALNAYLGSSNIGAMPWRHLAKAMQRDINREVIEDWVAFEAYCRGAAIAPAEVFIYILSCRVDGKLRTASTLPRPPLYYARDLALFCYLIHILRDLVHDARRHENLIVLPRAVLEEFGLDRGGLVAALRAKDWISLQGLADALVERATQHLSAGEQRLREIAPELSDNANQVLGQLVARYVDTFERLASDYPAHLATIGWGQDKDTVS